MSTTTSSERTKLGYGLREEEGEDFWLFGALQQSRSAPRTLLAGTA